MKNENTQQHNHQHMSAGRLVFIKELNSKKVLRAPTELKIQQKEIQSALDDEALNKQIKQKKLIFQDLDQCLLDGLSFRCKLPATQIKSELIINAFSAINQNNDIFGQKRTYQTDDNYDLKLIPILSNNQKQQTLQQKLNLQQQWGSHEPFKLEKEKPKKSVQFNVEIKEHLPEDPYFQKQLSIFRNTNELKKQITNAKQNYQHQYATGWNSSLEGITHDVQSSVSQLQNHQNSQIGGLQQMVGNQQISNNDSTLNEFLSIMNTAYNQQQKFTSLSVNKYNQTNELDNDIDSQEDEEKQFYVQTIENDIGASLQKTSIFPKQSQIEIQLQNAGLKAFDLSKWQDVQKNIRNDQKFRQDFIKLDDKSNDIRSSIQSMRQSSDYQQHIIQKDIEDNKNKRSQYYYSLRAPEPKFTENLRNQNKDTAYNKFNTMFFDNQQLKEIHQRKQELKNERVGSYLDPDKFKYNLDEKIESELNYDKIDLKYIKKY